MTDSVSQTAAPALAELWAALAEFLCRVLAAPLLLAGKERKGGKASPVKKGGEGAGRGSGQVDPPGPDDAPPEDGGGEEGDEEDVGGDDELLDEELAAAEEEGEEEEEPARRRGQSEWSGGSGADDLELIRHFLDGDVESFTRLVIKYQNKVYNLCFRILGDRDEAKDMAQEVFVTLHKSLKNFRGESLFSTWVYRVTVNHCKNRIKYMGRRRYYQTFSIDQPQEVEDGELYYEPEDESPDPETNMASEEIQALVQDAIAGLDPDHRIVVVLRDIQDLSYEEIADIVGIKVGTVKSRIHRARNDLKKKLEGKIKL